MAAVEQFEGYDFDFSPRSAEATRVFLVDPMSAAETDTPAYYDEHPDFPGLKLVNKHGVAYGATTSTRVPTHALVTCKYSNLAMEADGTPIVSYGIGSSVLELGSGRTWTGGGAVDQSLSRVVNHLTASVSMIILTENLGAWVACQNRINSLAWTPAWGNGFTFPAEQVRCDGVFASKEFDAEHGTRVRVRIELAINPERSWNMAWRSDTGAWNSTTNPLFETADFSMLGI